MKLTNEQKALIQKLYDERAEAVIAKAISRVPKTIAFNEVFPMVITKTADFLNAGYTLNEPHCNHFPSSPYLEVSLFKPQAMLEQERIEAVEIASEHLKAEIIAEVGEMIRQRKQAEREAALAEQAAQDAITTEEALRAALGV